jgi:hydrogenase expression/formation protein HypE
MGHGGGGRLTAELIDGIFLPAFRNPILEARNDAAVLPAQQGRLAFSTDSYVVRPIFFPGGCVGDLAVNGTVNDLAMMGAEPRHLAASFILEEGFPLADLQQIVNSMAQAAKVAGVTIVTGDVKVVERGHGDGCYVTTTGIGLIPEGVDLGPHLVRPGDVVLLSGAIGQHGIAILSVRAGLEFATTVKSDTAALADLVAAMLVACGRAIKMLRDPTRGGVAATVNEIARQAGVGIRLESEMIPVDPQVRAACELFGLDPLEVANEGRLLAIVAAEAAESLLQVMRGHPHGRQATRIGSVTAEHPGLVTERTELGGLRVVPMPWGEQLPRIC